MWMLLAAVLTAAVPTATTGLMDPKMNLQEALDQAAGVSLVQVSELKEVDTRPADGNLEIRIAMDTVGSSGDCCESLHVVKAYGGMRPPGPPPAPDPLFSVPFAKGERYYLLWASRELVGQHRLLGWWPAGLAPITVREAVAQDRYAWRPQYEPKTGIFFEHKADTGKRLLTVRARSRGKILWEKVLPGLPTSRFDYDWRAWPKRNVPDLSEVEDSPSNLFVFANIELSLAAGNEFDLPEGSYWIGYYLELETGRLAAVQVGKARPSVGECLLRVYDRNTGRARFERITVWIEHGGHSVGTKADAWLRQAIRRYDTATGKLQSEEFYRIEGSTPVKIPSPSHPTSRAS